MKIMYVKDLAEARREMKRILSPRMAIVFRNYNDKTLAAWVPDGYSSGSFVTRNNIKKNPSLSFAHNHGGSQGAFEELKHDVLAKKLIAGAAGKDLYRHPVRDARLRKNQATLGS